MARAISKIDRSGKASFQRRAYCSVRHLLRWAQEPERTGEPRKDRDHLQAGSHPRSGPEDLRSRDGLPEDRWTPPEGRCLIDKMPHHVDQEWELERLRRSCTRGSWGEGSTGSEQSSGVISSQLVQRKIQIDSITHGPRTGCSGRPPWEIVPTGVLAGSSWQSKQAGSVA